MSEQQTARVDDDVISFEWTLRTSPERVWPALTDHERLSRWLAPRVVLEPKVGGAVLVDWGESGTAEGSVTEIVPNQALEYTWGGRSWPETSTVRWQLRQADGGTRLRLVHRGLTGGDSRIRELAAGWHDFLDGLLAELGEREHPNRYEELVRRYAAS